MSERRGFRPVHFVVCMAIAAVAGVIASTVLAIQGRGSLEHLIAAWMPAVFLGLPLFGLGLAAFAFSLLRRAQRRGGSTSAWIATISFSAVLLLVVVAGSYLPGLLLNARDVRAAKRYCELLVPHVEEYRSRNGSYPPSIERLDVVAQEDVPRLLRETAPYYFTNGRGYMFEFADRSDLSRGYVFTSDDLRWETRD